MSNRAGRSKLKGNLRAGQTKRHLLYADEKADDKRHGIGKYATARIIQERVMALKELVKQHKAERSNERRLT